MFKVNPPLRTAGRRRRRAGGAGRRHHRRHRHRPRPARPGGQGAAVRPGAARACSASRRRWPLALSELGLPIDPTALFALLSWQPAAIVGPRRPRRRRRRAPGQPVRASTPPTDVDGRPRPPGQPQPQHPLRRPHPHRPGPPHRPRRRARRPRRGGHSDERTSPDRSPARPGRRHRPSRARPSAPTAQAASPPARSCSTPCCPATRRSSPTRPTPARSSPSPTPTSATTASNPADDESRRARSAAGVVVRELARRSQQLAGDEDLDAFLRAPRRARHRRHRHPPPHPPHPRRRRHARARSAPPTRPRSRRRRRPSRAPTASTWSPRSPPPSPTPWATARCRVVAYDFGIKRTILRHLGELATVEVVPAVDPGRRGAGPRARRRVPLQRPGRPGRRGLRRRRHPGPARASADLRHLPRPPAARHRARRRRPTSCRSATTAATTRCAARDGAGRDHQPEPQLRRRRRLAAGAEVTHVNLNDGVVEGLRCTDAPAFSVQYHPEAGPGPHDARYLFDEFADLMETGSQLMPQRTDIRVDPAHRLRARSSSARPASSTTRAPRPAGCCGRRATG